MPVAPTYPGVYVEELPSGVHTITGVSTSVTAFLGFFSQGPMNQATLVLSIADVERTFGALVPTSEAGYALRQFFANGGSQAWVVRVAGGSPAAAAIVLGDGAAKTPTAILLASAANQGVWGNGLRLSVDYNTIDPTASFNLTVTLVDTSSPPQVLATEVYRNLKLVANDSSNAVSVVNSASSLIMLTAQGSSRPAANGTVTPNLHSVDLTKLAGATTEVLLNTTKLGTVTLGSAPATLAALAAVVQTQIRALAVAAAPPALPAATVAVVGSAKGPTQLLQVLAGTGVATDIVSFATSAGSAPDLSALLSLSAAASNVQQYVLGASSAVGAQMLPTAGPTPGNDGAAPDANALMGDSVPPKTGLFALDAADNFNILCLPDVMNFADSDAEAVIGAAGEYCGPRWAFYIVDVPQSSAGIVGGSDRDSLSGIQEWLDANGTLRTSFSALYYPRPQIPDPLNGYRLRAVASSGTIAGLYAQTDSSRGVWKAPAGTAATLTNVSALTYKMTDAENGVLNPLAINCLRSLPVYGNVCWGARTLDGADQLASQWKYIPVRRTALYIEASLYQGIQWVVFEPNDEPLWSQIRLNVGSFMQGLFKKGAFQGSTPASAYFVKCDSETTTQADINLGIVNIIVGFAPLQPAEFVILQIQQIAGQIPT